MKQYPYYQVPYLTTLKNWILYSMREYGNKPAFYRNEKYHTRQELYSDVSRVSDKSWRKRRIGVCCRDTYYFTVAYLAIVSAGGIAVLISPSGNKQELIETVSWEYELTDEIVQKLIGSTQLETTLSVCDYEENECCTILFSSGTTNKPKGVMLSSKNLARDLYAGMEQYEYAEDARFINVIPTSHAFGLVCDILAPLFSGGVICCINSPYELFSVMPRFKPTALNLPPVLVRTILELSGSTKEGIVQVTGGELKKILSGGAYTSPKLQQRMRECGVDVYSCYGLSECGPCVSVNRDLFYKDGSCGLLLSCNHIEFSDDSEIIVVGDNVMLGYYPTYMDENRFCTGDIGYMDEDGFLYVTGRKNEMIVLENGTKIMPETIECMINRVEGVVESLLWLENSEGEERLYCQIVIPQDRCPEEIKKQLQLLDLNYRIDFIFQTASLQRNSQGKMVRPK